MYSSNLLSYKLNIFASSSKWGGNLVGYIMFSLLRKAFSCLSVMDSAGVGSSLIQHCIIPLQHIRISISTNYVYTGTKLVYTYYLEYPSGSLRRNWDPPPPHPSPASECATPLRTKRGGNTRACRCRGGWSQFGALSSLWLQGIETNLYFLVHIIFALPRWEVHLVCWCYAFLFVLV